MSAGCSAAHDDEAVSSALNGVGDGSCKVGEQACSFLHHRFLSSVNNTKKTQCNTQTQKREECLSVRLCVCVCVCVKPRTLKPFERNKTKKSTDRRSLMFIFIFYMRMFWIVYGAYCIVSDYFYNCLLGVYKSRFLQ